LSAATGYPLTAGALIYPIYALFYAWVAPPPSFLEAHPDVKLVSLEQVLCSSRFIVLCCDLNPGSRHIINADTLASMNPGSVIVNCARGPLIDEPALIGALQSGHIAGAGLDVFEVEPLSASSPLRGMSNVLLAPHNANSSPISHERVHWNTLKNLLTELHVPFEVATK
jgi:D-3-phosphoglycerate dehydrogenase